MASNKKKNTTRDTEKKIRQSRKFSVAEAIGRAGAGTLKGASPVPRSRQALMELERLLHSRLLDPEGSLQAIILLRLEQNPPLLDKHLAKPPEALRELLQKLLSSNSSLNALVRETDAHWGRVYQERPMFNRPGHDPRPGDPYTPANVRAALEDFLNRI